MSISSRITQDIEQACHTLKAGGIVGIPTETVYGLAAVALNEEAALVLSQIGLQADATLLHCEYRLMT